MDTMCGICWGLNLKINIVLFPIFLQANLSQCVTVMFISGKNFAQIIKIKDNIFRQVKYPVDGSNFSFEPVKGIRPETAPTGRKRHQTENHRRKKQQARSY